jgi:hypothetical protein
LIKTNCKVIYKTHNTQTRIKAATAKENSEGSNTQRAFLIHSTTTLHHMLGSSGRINKWWKNKKVVEESNTRGKKEFSLKVFKNTRR